MALAALREVPAPRAVGLRCGRHPLVAERVQRQAAPLSFGHDAKSPGSVPDVSPNGENAASGVKKGGIQVRHPFVFSGSRDGNIYFHTHISIFYPNLSAAGRLWGASSSRSVTHHSALLSVRSR